MYLLLQNMPLAGLDIESIVIGLIIFGSIIGKIKKASNSTAKNQKGAAGQSGPPSSPAKSTSEVQTELEDFLKTLVGGNAPITAPHPPPMPAVIKQTPPPQKPADIKQTPPPQKPAVTLIPKNAVDDHTCEATMELKVLTRKSEFTKSISTDLRENMSIRKAIVLREILGPPIALRH